MLSRPLQILVCSTALFALPIASAAVTAGKGSPARQNLDAAAIDNLFLAAKVWGYLKYHHPLVASGCLDWDRELLDTLPEILDAPDGKRGQKIVTSWIGDIQSKKRCPEGPAGERHLQPPTAWLGDADLLGKDLLRSLGSVARSPRSWQQHYVSLTAGVGNPVFESEADYADVDDFDWRYRLLALFRFWNVIEYWYPYRDVIGEDWDGVLREFIPRLYSAEGRDAYVLETVQLVSRVHDGHANLREAYYTRPPAGENLPPFDIRDVEGKPYVWRRFAMKQADAPTPDAAAEDGLRYGDVILEVDGKPADEIIRSALPYFGASNEGSRRRQITQMLLRGDTDHVSVRIERDGETLTVSNRRIPQENLRIESGMWHDHTGPPFQWLSDEIAYLKISNVEKDQVDKYVEEAAGSKGLVIDARAYPSAFVVFRLGQHLIREPTSFVRFTHADLSNPGAFEWSEPLSIDPVAPAYDGRVVILVDESTLSSAEYHAMAFRAAPNAMVVGSQTAGADGNVSFLVLPGGLHTLMTGLGVFYPDKTPTQRTGIVPDIEVNPTVAGLREGRDEVLEVALREIVGDAVPEDRIRRMASYNREEKEEHEP